MVQNKVGRPKNFTPNTALDAAIEVFWKKGYDGASLGDLTKAMGINRPSMYSTFGDKRSLYLSALSAYGAGIGSSPLFAFEAETDPENAVKAFLKTSLESQTRTRGLALGCLLASCAATTAGEIPGVAEILIAGNNTALQMLEEGFEKHKQSKLLPPNFPSNAKAKLLLDMMHGNAYRSRLGENRQILIDEINTKVAQVISSPN